LKNHAFITNLYPENEVRPEADYLAAQIHFERKNFNVAKQLLTGIEPGTPVYLYALYTLSIINIELNETAAAIQNLTTVVSDTTMDAAESMLQDAANLKLGHLYFEKGDKLRQAVEAYSRVSAQSPYSDEAMLATAWAWIKVNKPAICRETADRLVVRHPDSPLMPEAYLVKGYALMLLRKYREAVAALETCIELTKQDYVEQEEVQERKRVLDRVTQDFLPTAQDIKKNAFRKPTPQVQIGRAHV